MMIKRYELKIGKFGVYYHDSLDNKDLTLNDVLELLNELNMRKLDALGEALGGPQR